MKATKGFKLLATVLFTVASVALAWSADSKASPSLGNADCAKCHARQAADIDAKGMAHKTQIGCQDCHVGHPPEVPKEKMIPACSNCHTGKPHFKLPKCLSCHRNPHTPKVITFGKDVTDACLSCHTQQIAKFKSNPSKHAKLNCSFCHDVHGKIPQCVQCHKSHSADIGPGDCKKCHQAHMPLAVTYADNTPNIYCAACHSSVNTTLVNSKSKHSKALCVSCHQKKHKAIPKCSECHGVPHPAAIMAKFPVCGTCHNTAHDLNHWQAAAKKEAPSKAAVRSHKKKK